MICPICKKTVFSKDVPCPNCGFEEFHMEFLIEEDIDSWNKNIRIPFIKTLSNKVRFDAFCELDDNGYYKGEYLKKPIFIHLSMLSDFPIEKCPNEYLFLNLKTFEYHMFDSCGNNEVKYCIKQLDSDTIEIIAEGFVMRYSKYYSNMQESKLESDVEKFIYGNQHLCRMPYTSELVFEKLLNLYSFEEMVSEKIFLMDSTRQDKEKENYFLNWKLKKKDAKIGAVFEFVDYDVESDSSCDFFCLKLKFRDNKDIQVQGYVNKFIEELLWEIFGDYRTIDLYKGHLSSNDYSNIFGVDRYRTEELDDFACY